MGYLKLPDPELVHGDNMTLEEFLELWLSTPEHSQFVEQLKQKATPHV
jgi:hypothetical protein